MNKMKSIIKKAFMFLTLSVLGIAILSLFGLKTSVHADDSKVSVSVTTPNTTYTYTQKSYTSDDTTEQVHVTPNKGRITFNIEVSNLTDNETLELTYMTLDYTALTSEGEYTAKQETVTFSKASSSLTVNLDSIGSSLFAYKYSDHTNYDSFIFMITDLAVTSSTKASDDYTVTTSDIFYCDLSATKVLDVTTGTAADHLTEYDNYADNEKYFYAKAYGTGHIDWTSRDNLQTLLDDYVKTGLADCYFAMELHKMNESIKTCGDLWMHIKNASGLDMQKIHFDRGFSDSYFYYDKISNDSYSSVNVDNYVTSYVVNYAGTTMRLLKANSNSNPSIKDCTPYVYADNDDGGWSTASRSGYARVIETIQDFNAPTVKSCTIDTSHYAIDEKISAKVRFSEPVQFKKNSSIPYLSCTIRGTTTTFLMPLAAGSGTDTLYFNYDVSELPTGKEITQIIINGFVNKDGSAYKDIYDFARGTDGSTGNSIATATINKTITDISINMKAPEVSTSADVEGDAMHDIEVGVTVDGETKSATLYYVWTHDSVLKDANGNTLTESSLNFLSAFSRSLRVRNNTGYSKTYYIPSTDVSGNYLSGEYYLHVYVYSVSKRGTYTVAGQNVRSGTTKGFYLDPTSPTVSKVNQGASEDSYKTKTFIIDAEDPEILASDGSTKISGFATATLAYSVKTDQKILTGSFLVYNYESSSASTLYDEDTKQFTFTISYVNLNMLYNDEECVNEDGTPDVDSHGYYNRTNHGLYTFTLTLTDKAGNQLVYKMDSQYYDTRPIFEVTVNDDGSAYKDITSTEKAYQITDAGHTINVSTKETPTSTGLWVQSVYYKGTYLYENNAFNADNGSYKSGTEGDQTLPDVSSVITIKQNSTTQITVTLLSAGYYEIIYSMDKSKYTISYSYYITKDFKDETANYETFVDSHSIKSKVFQLTTQYSYIGSDWSKGVKNVYYNGTSSTYPVSFSSLEKAKSYVRYMEMQDLYMVVLDGSSTIASSLNSGGLTEYTKATEDANIQAGAGQVWVRYKSSSWKPGAETTCWCYYYYGKTTDLVNGTLNTSKLSDSLTTVMNKIVDYITLQGTYKYLGNEDYTDSFGMCYLRNTQFFAEKVTATETMSGTQFQTPLSFAADTNIYSDYYLPYSTAGGNGIKYDGTTGAKFLLHLELSSGVHGKMYYSRVDETSKSTIDYNNVTWTEIDTDNITYLDDAFAQGTVGTYLILELNDAGCNIFEVCVDKSAPQLKITYRNKDDSNTEMTLDSSANGLSLGVRYITFDSFLDSERDTYSYITIYKKYGSGMGTVIASYDFSDLLSKTITIDDGSYYVKVSDRYGNSFTLTISQNSTELDAEVKIVDESYLSVTCSRESDEILTYKVELNGEVISDTYSQSAKFTQTGFYTVTISDVYGNTKIFNGEGNGLYFKRKIPEVTWAWLEDGNYTTYKVDESGNPVEDQSIKITPISDNVYYIISCAKVRFTYTSDECEFEFSDDSVSYSQGRGTGGTTRVEIDSTDAWTLKVWYTANPDVYVEYSSKFDTQAPSVDASYTSTSYVLKDKDNLDKIAASQTEDGYIIAAKSIEFTAQTDDEGNPIETTNTIRSGETVQTDKVSITITDENNIKSVYFYFNDSTDAMSISKPDKTVDPETKAETKYTYSNTLTFEVSESGKYKVVTQDIFGNATSFTFTLDEVSSVTRIVDGAEVTDSDTAYGNSNVEVVLSDTGIFNVEITEGEKDYIYTFRVTDTIISRTIYQTFSQTVDGDKSYSWGVQSLYNIYNTTENVSETDTRLKYQSGTWYKVSLVSIDWFMEHRNDADKKLSTIPFALTGTEELDPVTLTIEIMVDSDGCHFRFTPSSERETIRIAYLSDVGTSPVTLESIISKEVTDIPLLEDGNAIETNHDSDAVLIHSGFTVDYDNMSDLVSRIRVSYSKTNSFSNFTTIYTDGKRTQFDSSREGFYEIQIINKFGNILNYVLVKSTDMQVIVTAIYSDDSTNTYDTDYAYTVYSNAKVRITVYDKEGTFTILKEGSNYPISPVTKGDSRYITASEAGTYTCTIEDSYGNVKVRKFEIKKDGLEVDDDIIFGLSEDALYKDLGYTKDMASISFPKVIANNISYISITKGDSTTVVYDTVSEKTVYATDDSLMYCIGKEGTGEYTICFRNKYGSKQEMVIHYSAEPTLSITKNSRTDVEFYPVDLSLGEVWGNNVINLTSTSIHYNLSIDNMVTQAPYKFSFDLDEGFGRFEHTIHYQDEYGYILDIKVYLLRQNIDVALDESITDSKVINDVLTTRQQVKITYTSDTKCYYTLDGGASTEYTSDSVLLKDGVYRFTVTDEAGNMGNLTVAKDTSLEFSFTQTKKDNVMISGFVDTYGSVEFKALNSDTAYIYKVIKDGAVYELEDENKFTETGKYEVLIRDEMGNEGYFMFYIITHEIKELDYTCPDSYVISYYWYTSEKGYRESYLDYVVDGHFDAKLNGEYSVVLQSTVTSKSLTFDFTINTAEPTVTLVGVNEGETTLNTVTLSGFAVGDTIKIYKDGELSQTILVDSMTSSPEITDGGSYKIVVTNIAGVEKTLTFTKTKTLNTAGSVLIIILVSAVALALFIGLLMRKRSKIDK